MSSLHTQAGFIFAISLSCDIHRAQAALTKSEDLLHNNYKMYGLCLFMFLLEGKFQSGTGEPVSLSKVTATLGVVMVMVMVGQWLLLALSLAAGAS